MAKVTTISVAYGRKHNLGDFNSLHAEVTVWADLEDGDDEAAVVDALRTMARNNVMNEVGRVEPKLEARTRNLFLGLMVESEEKGEEKDAD